MAAVTGSIARGFVGASTAAATSATTSASTAVASAASPSTATAVAVTPTSTRMSGVGLDLGRASAPSLFGSASGRSDLFVDLRSALAGFDAQSGFDQALVTQLIGAD